MLSEAQREAASQAGNRAELTKAANRFSIRLDREFPIQWDWCLQDAGHDFQPWLSTATQTATARQAATRVLAEIGTANPELQAEFDRLTGQAGTGEAHRWLEFYSRAAGLRRGSPPLTFLLGILNTPHL